ncbi:MAG TPA: hypothetical protein VFQ43_09675 [Nitrososphaera sp.]|nr:hypothetical protein [Nitrososphaera sp.]
MSSGEHWSLEESEFMREHPWCMMPHWDEGKAKTIPCGKPIVAVVSTVSLVTKWEDTENWRTLCAEHLSRAPKVSSLLVS